MRISPGERVINAHLTITEVAMRVVFYRVVKDSLIFKSRISV